MKKFLYYYGIYRFCWILHKTIWEFIPDTVRHFTDKHSEGKNEQRKVGFSSTDSKGPMARIGF